MWNPPSASSTTSVTCQMVPRLRDCKVHCIIKCNHCLWCRGKSVHHVDVAKAFINRMNPSSLGICVALLELIRICASWDFFHSYFWVSRFPFRLPFPDCDCVLSISRQRSKQSLSQSVKQSVRLTIGTCHTYKIRRSNAEIFNSAPYTRTD